MKPGQSYQSQESKARCCKTFDATFFETLTFPLSAPHLPRPSLPSSPSSPLNHSSLLPSVKCVQSNVQFYDAGKNPPSYPSSGRASSYEIEGVIFASLHDAEYNIRTSGRLTNNSSRVMHHKIVTISSPFVLGD